MFMDSPYLDQLNSIENTRYAYASKSLASPPLLQAQSLYCEPLIALWRNKGKEKEGIGTSSESAHCLPDRSPMIPVLNSWVMSTFYLAPSERAEWRQEQLGVGALTANTTICSLLRYLIVVWCWQQPGRVAKSGILSKKFVLKQMEIQEKSHTTAFL